MQKSTIIFLLICLTSCQTMREELLSDTGEKTASEVASDLQCLNTSKWQAFFQTNFPDLGIEFIRAQLQKGASPNKKYYIHVNDEHNVMYFKEGNNYFIHLNKLDPQGEDQLLMRAFQQDDFKNCIQLLPDSCVWKGQREVKYIEVCEEGGKLNQALYYDLFNLIIDEEEGVFDPGMITQAIRECYQPNVYSIGYLCYMNGMYFKPEFGVTYLNQIKDRLVSYGYEAWVDLDKMTVEFKRTIVQVNPDQLVTEGYLPS